MLSPKDLSKMTVVQLREQLRSRGLPTDGTKMVLIERLKGNIAAEESILNSDASISKDSLEETVLQGAINEDDILGPDTSLKKREDALLATAAERPIRAVSPSAKEPKTAQRPEVGQKSHTAEDTLDAKTKRAQRFGLPLSAEQMKQKRAERFGMQSSAAASTAESLEERKRKRAERFGIATTEKMEDILDKRAKRFGIDSKIQTNKIGGVEKASLEVLEKRAKRFGICSEEAELEMKKQKRAERFGLNKN